jgi:hypothetical protein
LYGWSLREEQKLQVFENKMLTKIFRPKKGVVSGQFRVLHNRDFNDYTSHPGLYDNEM